MAIKVFIDSDVFVSSLISKTGAANFLINNESELELFVSDISVKEISEVMLRLRLKSGISDLLKRRFSKIILKDSLLEIKLRYKKYVTDIDDAHIVAGAEKGNVRFLISYNIKDFKADKIKGDFGILVMSPAQFLQYLRSLK